MAEISAAQVKELRDMTGSGIMDCKRALQESEGDIEKAVAWLREKGIAKAEKKSARVAAEGAVIAKIADDKKSGVLVEINIETDFAANTDKFKAFADAVATHILLKILWLRHFTTTIPRQLSSSRRKLSLISERILLSEDS